MTWAMLLNAGRERLSKAGVPDAELDAWYLFEHAFGISRAAYFLQAAKEADAGSEALAAYEDMLKKRESRIPLQHILGSQEFMGLSFLVNRHVLVPRQDTETLVETILSEQKGKNINILDMCTGSGCIAVSLAALGGYEHVEAADISEEALLVAEENARRLFPAGHIRFRKSDLFSAFGRDEQFDVIASNPPYIPTEVIAGLEPEVREFEPKNALDGDWDGLSFYRSLAAESPRHLTAGGRIYMEIGWDQGEAVCGLLSSQGFTDIRVIKDLAGKDRVVCGMRPAGM